MRRIRPDATSTAMLTAEGDAMRISDMFWTAVSVCAILFGLVVAVIGRTPLGLPALAIGALLLWTTVSNWKRKT